MKRKKAKALLDKTILDLGDTLADIVFEAQLLVHSYKTVGSGETITFDSKRNIHTHHSIGEWWHSLSADDLTQKRGSCHFYVGSRGGDKESIVERFPVSLNSQFRWLLVSGYEAYERFLLKLYAELGFCDRNLWRCADFGNRYHVNEISSLSLSDFRQRVSESSDIHPDKIRNLMGHHFPAIQKAEANNSILFSGVIMTHKDYVDLIALMRHIIVHEQSQIEPDDFFLRLNKKWKRNADLSEIWVCQNTSNVLKTCTGLDRHLRSLLEDLATHACLIYGESIKHFGHDPFWKESKNMTL